MKDGHVFGHVLVYVVGTPFVGQDPAHASFNGSINQDLVCLRGSLAGESDDKRVLAAESIDNGARVGVVDVLGEHASRQGSLASGTGQSSDGVEFAVQQRLRDVLAAVSTGLGDILAVALREKRGWRGHTPTMATLSTWLAIVCISVKGIECAKFSVGFVADFLRLKLRAALNLLIVARGKL